jgi:glycerol-3-phosphate acyltransferase PlsY
VLVLVCDAAKAYLPLLLARHLLAGIPGAGWWIDGVGLAAVLGHLFPPWLGFRGGKGVASSLGVFLAVQPLAAGIGAAIWVPLVLVTKIASVGSLAAAAAVLAFLLLRPTPRPDLALVGALFMLILFSHRGNLRRLLRRQEAQVR